jgi:hypothetical protein
MKYSKILLCMTVLVCLGFQACAQSDPLGESPSSSKMGSSGDYLDPNMGQMSRDTNPDEGGVRWCSGSINRSLRMQPNLLQLRLALLLTLMLPNQKQPRLARLPARILPNQLQLRQVQLMPPSQQVRLLQLRPARLPASRRSLP